MLGMFVLGLSDVFVRVAFEFRLAQRAAGQVGDAVDLNNHVGLVAVDRFVTGYTAAHDILQVLCSSTPASFLFSSLIGQFPGQPVNPG